MRTASSPAKLAGYCVELLTPVSMAGVSIVRSTLRTTSTFLVRLPGPVDSLGHRLARRIGARPGPLVGHVQAGQGTLEMGHHIARHELVAAQHFVSGGEILGETHQEAAEATAPFIQALDGLNTVIRRADNPLTRFHQMLEDFLDRVPPDCLVVLDEAYAEYVRDPDAPDGLQLYRDRPRDEWPKTPDGEFTMYTRPLDVEALLAEAAAPAGG